MIRPTVLVSLVGIVLGIAISGCAASQSSNSISESSGSISDSSGSVSDSFSSSSDSSSSCSGGEDSAYRRDVESVTLVALDAHASAEALLLDLGRVAARHGVADWESLASTYRGVGAGMRRAGLDSAAASAFGDRVFGSQPEVTQWLHEGYRS